MSLKNRAVTAIVLSVILIGLAVLVWAYQTGKVTIFGSQQTTQGTITHDTQDDWKKGIADKTDFNTNPGFLQLSLKQGFQGIKWTKIEATGGPADKLLYAGDTNGPFSKLIGSNQGNVWAMDTTGIFGSAFVYDAKEDKFLLMGLSSEGYPVGGPSIAERKVYSFDPKTKTWEKWTTPNTNMQFSFLAGNVLFYYPNNQKTYYMPRISGPYNEAYKYYEIDWQGKKFVEKSAKFNNEYPDNTNSAKPPMWGEIIDTKNNVLYSIESNFSGSVYNPYPIPIQQNVDCSTDACTFTHIIWKTDPITGVKEKLYDPAFDAGGYSFINQKDYSVAYGVKISPVPTGDGIMAFDSDKNQIIFFGSSKLDSITAQPAPGKKNISYSDEIWVFNLSTKKWRKIDTSPTPPARKNAQMVYDPLTKSTILFGGQSNNGVTFGDTWTYSPENELWTKVTPSAPEGLAPRTQQLMVYDSTRKCAVTFGGRQGLDYKTGIYNEKDVMLGDLWSFCTQSYEPAGSYIVTYGSNDIISWDKFICGPKDLPQNTKATYQFAGSTDNVNFSTYSAEQECPAGGEIALTGVIPTSSKHIRTKINLTTTDPTKTPVIDFLKINYTLSGVVPPTPSQTPTPTTAATTPGTSGGGGGGSRGPGSLISTGAVLWFNLLIALTISATATYILLRKKEG